jgi:hypothetical protein
MSSHGRRHQREGGQAEVAPDPVPVRGGQQQQGCANPDIVIVLGPGETRQQRRESRPQSGLAPVPEGGA